MALGQGARFATPPFNASVWPSTVRFPEPTNAQIVRVTAIVGDVVSFIREQEATTAWAIQAGDLIAQTITEKTLADLSATAPALYVDLLENAPGDPQADTARLHALDVNGYTAVEVRDGNAKVVRLASDNVLVGKVAEPAGIGRGQIVYLAGASGANPLLGLARADALATLPTVGMALDSGATNAFIRVLLSGTLQLLNTAAFAEGASLYVSPVTAGGITTTLPVAPAFAQRVGFVTRSHATQGEVLVLTTSIDGPPRLHADTHAPGGTDPLPFEVTGPAGPQGPEGPAGEQGPAGPTGTFEPLSAATRLVGRGSDAGAGPAEEITLSNSLIMSGTELTVRSGVFNYTYNSAITDPPAAGQVRIDAVSPWTSATKLWMRFVSADGQDLYWGIMLIADGATLLLQDKDEHMRYVRFTTTGAPIDKGLYAEVPVVWQANGSAINTASQVFLRVAGTITSPSLQARIVAIEQRLEALEKKGKND